MRTIIPILLILISIKSYNQDKQYDYIKIDYKDDQGRRYDFIETNYKEDGSILSKKKYI
jgi:hypothetical protein